MRHSIIKKAPKALLIFLIAFLVFEGAVATLNRDPMTPLKKTLIQNESIDVDVLFLGDSSVTHGIDVRLFKSLTGLSAYNLGTMQVLAMPSFYLLFKEYVRHQQKPKYLVLMQSPQTWSFPFGKKYDFNFDYYFRGDFRITEFLFDGLSLKLWARYFLWGALPSVAHNAYLKDVIFEDRRDALHKRYDNLGRLTDLMQENQGTMLRDQPEGGYKCPHHSQIFSPWELQDVNKRYLAKTLEFAKQQGIQVFYVSAPFAAKCFNSEEIAQLQGVERQIQKNFPELNILQPDALAYSDDKISNTAYHLSREEAANFTRMIATRFKQQQLSEKE